MWLTPSLFIYYWPQTGRYFTLCTSSRADRDRVLGGYNVVIHRTIATQIEVFKVVYFPSPVRALCIFYSYVLTPGFPSRFERAKIPDLRRRPQRGGLRTPY